MDFKPKILVTGANGQLGMELRELSNANSSFEFIFLGKEELPIHQAEAIRNSFKKIQPQYCINCAAYTNVDKAEEEIEIAFQINATAVGLLAEICKEYSTKFIHLSTDYVFDGFANTPYLETAPTNPQSIYGSSKLEGEKQAIEFNSDSIIIRTSWVYSSYSKNFVKTMLRLMNEKKEINVVYDQIGSPTYAADLAALILKMITIIQSNSEKQFSGIYNFSNSGIISWYEFALAIKEITESDCKINSVSSAEFVTKAVRPSYSVFDKEKIQTVFEIQLKDWKVSLKSCLGKINQSSH